MSAETLERLGWWLAWAYPMNMGVALCYGVIMFVAYLQYRQPHMLTALMIMLTGAVMFAGFGVTAFNRPFDSALLVARVPAAALAVALVVHMFASGVEEWHRRRAPVLAADAEAKRRRLQEQIARLREERERETDEARREQLRYWIAALELQLEELAG